MGQRPRAHPVRLSTQLFVFVFGDWHVFVAVRTANLSFVCYFIVDAEIPPTTWAFEFKQGFHDFFLDEIESRRRSFLGSDRDFFALGSPEDFPESPFHPDFCVRRFGAMQRHTKQDFAA